MKKTVLLLTGLVVSADASLVWTQSSETVTINGGTTPVATTPGGPTNTEGVQGVTEATIFTTGAEYGLGGDRAFTTGSVPASFQLTTVGGGAVDLSWDKFTPPASRPNVGGIPIARSAFNFTIASGNISSLTFDVNYGAPISAIAPTFTSTGALTRILFNPSNNGGQGSDITYSLVTDGAFMSPRINTAGGAPAPSVVSGGPNVLSGQLSDTGGTPTVDLQTLQGTSQDGSLTNIRVTLSPQGGGNFIVGSQYRLTFDGIIASQVPEPSAAFLGLVAGLGLLRRRR